MLSGHRNEAPGADASCRAVADVNLHPVTTQEPRHGAGTPNRNVHTDRRNVSRHAYGYSLFSEIGDGHMAAQGYQGKLELDQWVSVSRSSIWLTCRGGVANVA